MTTENFQLSTMQATYVQDEDSCGRPNVDAQEVELSTHDAGDGPYYVIQTERWAFNSKEELMQLIDDFIARTKHPA